LGTAVLEDLYREVILRHYQSPANRRKLAEPDAQSYTQNPLCGDEITVAACIEDDRLTDVAFEARGCAISQASADMMADLLRGKTSAAAGHLADQFKRMMEEGEEEPTDEIGDLAALRSIRKYPVRIKCALLPWTTLLDALRTYRAGVKEPSGASG
jgi:nitrogen fixation NifU-like protein